MLCFLGRTDQRYVARLGLLRSFFPIGKQRRWIPWGDVGEFFDAPMFDSSFDGRVVFLFLGGYALFFSNSPFQKMTILTEAHAR